MSISFISEKEEITANIEGLIFKVGNDWIAGFQTTSGIVLRTKVDYNPWTGEKLHAEENNTFHNKCPKCGSENLDYDVMIPQDSVLSQEIQCKDCGHEFEVLAPIKTWFIEKETK